jgi:hypothetical protein
MKVKTYCEKTTFNWHSIFDEIKQVIREKFLGFVEFDAMDAKTIALTIDNFITDSGLDQKKFIGQGYDSCEPCWVMIIVYNLFYEKNTNMHYISIVQVIN